MKTKEVQSTKFLIHEDSTRRNFQEVFLSNLSERLTELLNKFESLDTEARFSLEDIDQILNHSAQSFIRGKVIPTIDEPSIAGKKLKLSPDKVFDMVDLDLSAFETAYRNVTEYIQETKKKASERYDLGLLIDHGSNFFLIEDATVKVNQSTFESWVDTYCREYADSESKQKAYSLMDSIAKALNELRDLAPKGEYPGQNRTFGMINSNYPSIVLSSIGRLIEFNDSKGEFQVKHDGYIRSF